MRRKLSDTSHPDGTLTDDYWLQWGNNPQPSMRDKILLLTIEQVAEVGPGGFNSSAVCDRLGVTYPMVNHYFDSRDGLLATGLFEVYRRYVAALADAVDSAPMDARARLEAWMNAQITETMKMGGWVSILNFPSYSLHITGLLEEFWGQDMQDLFELNVARLGFMVRDLRDGTLSKLPRELNPEIRAELLADWELTKVVGSVAWSTLGAAVWQSGRPMMSSTIPEVREHYRALIEGHINFVLSGIK